VTRALREPLDDRAEIERLDVHNACDVLRAFPVQCRRALRLRLEPALECERPKLVIVAGMGGSGACGDLLVACAADRLDVPILAHRGYGLPPVAGAGALIIAASYSGDTEEVVSALEAMIERGLPGVAITAGGRLGALAAQHAIPTVTLPGGLMPRMALGHLFFPALSALASVGLDIASAPEIEEALDAVDVLAEELGPERPTATNEAKALARAIDDRMPVIYGGPETGGVAYRWKTDVEENAKTFAAAGVLPEVNHNEIEAWRAPGARRLHLVLLRDRAERAEIARRFAVLHELVGDGAGGVSEIWARGRGRLARLLSLVYVGQWTSYYLALLRHVDPWSVPILEELKRRIRPVARA
jgi:glucose/mannose-6-phosphate isomerase